MPRRYALLLLGATLLALAHLGMAWLTHGIANGAPLPRLAIYVVPWSWWVAFVAVLARVVRRVPAHGAGAGRALAAYAAAAVGCAALDSAMFRVLGRALGRPVAGSYADTLLLRMDLTILIATAALALLAAEQAAAAWAEDAARAARLRAELARAQLEVLGLQMQPHFLFNTLNAIAALVHEDPGAARATMRDLRSLLAVSFDRALRAEVSLEEELQFLDAYVAIQRRRFPGLRVSIEAGHEARAAAVPHLLLQPLVENAVRHGLERRGGPGAVAVRAWTAGTSLHIEVSDDGEGLGDAPRGERGLGLRNLRARLAQLPGRHHFELRPRAQGGTVAALSLALRRAA